MKATYPSYTVDDHTFTWKYGQYNELFGLIKTKFQRCIYVFGPEARFWDNYPGYGGIVHNHTYN